MADENVVAAPGGLKIPAGLKPLLLLVGVAAAVAAGVGVALWSQGPTYSLLFGNLAEADKAQVVQSLEQNAIPYRLDGATGGVLVPADKVSEARMRLAAKGLPESGGFSLIEKDSGFGVSQFMEGARYQHAIETELARTISSLKQVEGARVHLAVPQQATFIRDRRPATASVFLQLRAGRRLEREQVTSIVNLVASSIPELDAKQVTVIDSQGRLLSAPEKDGEFAAREQQLEIARRMEEDYSQRIVSLLTPLLGPDRVRAQVVAQIEMSATEEAREQYRPDSQVVRSEQTSEESSRNGSGNGGVPGSLTNQPPQGGVITTRTAQAAAPTATPAAAPRAPAGAAAAQAAAASTTPPAPPPPDNTSKQSTRSYELDRTVAYTRQPAGRLQRLSVAVLVDNLRTTDAEGKTTEAPLTEEQIGRFTTLVKDAVGFDEKRGDSVSVVNQGFHPTAQPEVPEMDKVPLWEQPMVRDLAKLLSGLVIVALLLILVVRPLIRNLTAGGAQPRARLAAAGPVGELPPITAAGAEAGAPVVGGAPLAASPVTGAGYDQQIAAARGHVTKDPARVAQVVKDWVQADD